jgi:hypothetical protein
MTRDLIELKDKFGYAYVELEVCGCISNSVVVVVVMFLNGFLLRLDLRWIFIRFIRHRSNYCDLVFTAL